MRLFLALLVFLGAGMGVAGAKPGSSEAGPANRILMIDSSSMPVAAGKATLTIGALHRAGGVYTGDYKMKVFPYFFKSENGTLAIEVSDASLARMNKGQAAAIIGTATTGGKHGETRHIDAIATPLDIDHGTLKLWFMSGNRKMIFRPGYRFSGNLSANTAGPKAETNLTANVSYRER
jgi:hypothetical protein